PQVRGCICGRCGGRASQCLDAPPHVADAPSEDAIAVCGLRREELPGVRCRPRLALRNAWISRPAGLCGLLVLPRLGAFLPVRRAVLLLHERVSGFRVAPPVWRSLDLAIEPSHSSNPPD